jgi:histidinol dehydrogenase
MPIIKNYKSAKKKVKEISSRFDLSKRKKEYEIVEKIVEDVKNQGDKALFLYSKKFDKQNLKTLKVNKKELDGSLSKISKPLLASIKTAISRITTFQETNSPKSWVKTFKHGEKLGYKYSPLDSVAVYIPGGHSPLISTVLMTVIPAKVAGVKRIAVFTPPPVNPGILAACKLLNINEVYQIGGAQAIAACAYGSKTIKPFCKVVGPGNIFVTLAKKIVFGKIGIDGLFGPSEIAIVADKSANPKYLALDLLSQLEHGSGLESAFMLTDSAALANETEKELLKHAQTLSNKETVLKSWKNNSAIVVVANLNKGIELINDLAPEHLEIITKSPQKYANKIRNAGAIFIGEYTCESVGDYVAGPSHCLPTGGSAKFSSGLTVMDFMKKISILSFNKKAFNTIASHVSNLADAEGLKAHGDAVRMRR